MSFILPVHGETDNYSVEFLFEGITDDIKREIERNNGVLEYTTYEAVCTVSVSDLGGAAEDEAEFSFEMQLIGTATEVSA